MNNIKTSFGRNKLPSHLQFKIESDCTLAKFCLFYDWDGTIFDQSIDLLKRAQDLTASKLTNGKITSQKFPLHLESSNSIEVAKYFVNNLNPHTNVSINEYLKLRDKIFLELINQYNINSYDYSIVNKIDAISQVRNIHIPQIIVTASSRERILFGIKKFFGKKHLFNLIITYDDIYDHFKIHPTSKHKSFNFALDLLNFQTNNSYKLKDVYIFEDSSRAIMDAKTAKLKRIIEINSLRRHIASDYTTHSLVDGIDWVLKQEVNEDADLKTALLS